MRKSATSSLPPAWLRAIAGSSVKPRPTQRKEELWPSQRLTLKLGLLADLLRFTLGIGLGLLVMLLGLLLSGVAVCIRLISRTKTLRRTPLKNARLWMFLSVPV